jgi:2-oxoglutarate ferredoxin oxidoreductase subunit delta
MAKKKSRVVVKDDMCKGCGLCIHYCKNEVLGFSENFNKQGYHYASPLADKECIGCLVCSLVCPEVAIEVYDE